MGYHWHASDDFHIMIVQYHITSKDNKHYANCLICHNIVFDMPVVSDIAYNIIFTTRMLYLMSRYNFVENFLPQVMYYAGYIHCNAKSVTVYVARAIVLRYHRK